MSQVNSYGHCGTVSSPNHTFSWASLGKLEQAVNQYFMHILSFVTDIFECPGVQDMSTWIPALSNICIEDLTSCILALCVLASHPKVR